MRGIQTVCLHKLGRSAGLTEAVGSVDKFYRSRLACCKNAGNGLSETSCHIVLLCNDCATCLGDALKYGLFVKRLDGCHVEDFRAYSLGLECLGCLKRLPYEVSASDDGNILSFIEIVNLSNLERLV